MCSSQLRLMASEVNTAHSEINRLSGTFFCVFSLRLPLPIFFCSFEVLTTLLPSPWSTPLNGEQRDHSPAASTLFQDLRGSVHVFVWLMCPKRLDEVREGRQPLVFARFVCRTSQNRGACVFWFDLRASTSGRLAPPSILLSVGWRSARWAPCGPLPTLLCPRTLSPHWGD